MFSTDNLDLELKIKNLICVVVFIYKII